MAVEGRAQEVGPAAPAGTHPGPAAPPGAQPIGDSSAKPAAVSTTPVGLPRFRGRHRLWDAASPAIRASTVRAALRDAALPALAPQREAGDIARK